MQPTRLLRRLLHDQHGATAVEYGLILALVFLAMLGGVVSLGSETGSLWSYLDGEITKER